MPTKAKKPASKRKNVGKDFFSFAKNNMSSESVAKAEAKAQVDVLNIRLAALREKFGIKQTEVTGFTQSSISKLESRDDMKVSTLLQFLEGLNMDVEIRVHPKGKSKKDDEFELLNTGS